MTAPSLAAATFALTAARSECLERRRGQTTVMATERKGPMPSSCGYAPSLSRFDGQGPQTLSANGPTLAATQATPGGTPIQAPLDFLNKHEPRVDVSIFQAEMWKSAMTETDALLAGKRLIPFGGIPKRM